MAKILIIDDEKAMRQAMVQIFQDEGYQTIEAGDGNQGLKLIQDCNPNARPDLVFLDLKMPRTQGMTVLKTLGKVLLDLPVIVITAYGTGRTAIEAMQLGAYDYITKPFKLETLLSLTEKALAQTQTRVSVSQTATTQGLNSEELLGKSAAMAEVFKLIGRVAQTDTTVLILGESGTGKELVASILHNSSRRSRSPLVKVNCAALPEHLLEAELFGHEKGAFTGADHLRIGRFEQANGGTIFLDELGELSPGIQGKLLRVLQDLSFERLGSNQTRTVDVRIIAATNRNLETMVQRQQFREDLYYRLNVMRIDLPPLRDRIEDLELLTQHFLNRLAIQHNFPRLSISEAAFAKLRKHSWPGNVRELQNTLERAVILSGGRILLPDHLSFNQMLRPDLNLETAITKLEQDLIRQAISLYPDRAHEALGLDIATFTQKCEQWNL
ncbi:MAG: sigma-54-dependent Fis family transcriptional regulator [Calothrix sp. C42_A2020_038]|nr:sigma-54-dependent Fis family transcriptional regulator [Calothrix sp. C42_A2020_038]